MENNPLGATRDEWDHFSLILGLTGDMLPVVSNPDAVISPQSKMKSLGKTPSRYNSSGQVAGIANWTTKHSTAAEIAHWSQNPDYGICIQTRTVRALDCDISSNAVFAKDVHDEINKHLSAVLPTRWRQDSPKFLLAFEMPGDYSKRQIYTDHGVIEFLATGQQFIAAGQHQNGARYEWAGGLPDEIPVLTPEQFESLWLRLIECFATDGTSTDATQTIRHTKISEATKNDPIAQSLVDKGLALSTERDGRIHLVCPFSAEHTGDSDDSATTYFPAFTGGFERGHFKCLHAHCAKRTDGEFLDALGIASSAIDDFDIIDAPEAPDAPKNKFTVETWEQSADAKPPTFIIKGVLPEAALAVIYGAPGSGKSFLAEDMGFAIARGIPWRDLKTKQGGVVYIAAEDASGIRMRTRAYTQEHKIERGTVPFGIIGAVPNFMEPGDVKEVIKAVRAYGSVRVIFVDTWSRVIAGFDENSAEAVTKAVKYCGELHKHTGALVVLIHHSGKDSSKGARGSSVLLGACDCEIEVTRCDDDREAEITKLKNGADGARFAFKLNVVPVCEDEDGQVVSSCVLEHTQTKVKAARGSREPKGVNEKIVLRALNDLSIGGAVTTAEVIDAAVAHMAFDTASGKRDKRREHTIRALNALVERNVLQVNGNEISLGGDE